MMSGQSRLERALVFARTQSAQIWPTRTNMSQTSCKAMNFSSSLSSTSPPPNSSQGWVGRRLRGTFQSREGSSWDQSLNDGLPTVDTNNFLNTPRVITLIMNMGGNLKIWGHLAGTKNAYSNLWIAQIESPELKKMAHFCSVSFLVLLHPFLYRVLKPTFLTNIGGIVTEGQFTSDIWSGSLGQSIGVVTLQISTQSVFKGLGLKSGLSS